MSKALSVRRSFSISSGDVTIFMFCKALTVGDTRRPGVCGSDFLLLLLFFHSSCFLLYTTLKSLWLELF